MAAQLRVAQGKLNGTLALLSAAACALERPIKTAAAIVNTQYQYDKYATESCWLANNRRGQRTLAVHTGNTSLRLQKAASIYTV